MSYFRELPDLEYQSPLPDKNSSLEYVRVKNLFRRVKLRDDLQNVLTLFNKYQIPDGARPDTVAEELYGKADYDWVVLLSAGITNARDQWPLSDRDIYKFSEQKYGISGLDDPKFYETTEVKDSNGRLILPAGKVVDSYFKISYFDNGKLYTNDQSILGSNVIYIQNPVNAVTNYEYEVRKNNDKRSIYLLRPVYLQQYVNDLRKIMYYEKSSQYVNKKLIRTENTRNTMP
jgi:hypothetical protein